MSFMKFSFILPVYNVEAYLRECVSSLTSQTYDNIEIILVDDGSQDESPTLCDQLANEDIRIKVIHKLNGGLSSARNAGLMLATGDYILFVDSDDFWIGRDSLERLTELVDRYPGCNFYGFNCQYYYPGKWVPYFDDICVPVNGSLAMLSLVRSGTMPMSACLKVIDRKWLLDEKIDFKVGQISEDVPWFINLLDKCDKCVFVNDYIYAYRQNVSGSITASVGEKSFNSVLEIIKTEIDLIDERSFTDDAKNSLVSFLAYELILLIAFTKRLPKSKQNESRAKLKELSWLLGYAENPKVRMVSKVYRFCGYTITELLLSAYLWYKSAL